MDNPSPKTTHADVSDWASKAASTNQTIAQYLERAFDLQRKKERE